jgi:hypothetical protein
MTDEQAERGIRELRGIRVAIFMVGVVLAVFAGLKLGESLSTHDPSSSVQAELSAIRTELQLMRSDRSQQQNPPPFGAPAPKSIGKVIPVEPK